VRWAKKAAGNQKWGWEDIVTVCKDVHTGCALSRAPEPTVPLTPATTAPRLPTGGAPGQLGRKPGRRCEICDRLGGVGADTHTKEWCFCNPASKMYKREVHERRVN
jgi:hypothetical protein